MKKKIVSSVLAAAMLLCLLAGCGSGSTDGTAKTASDPDAKKFETEGITVSWWLMGGTDEYYQTYWTEMEGLKAIQESVGIQIQFKVATGYESYLPMMAAKDYPDVITAKNMEQYKGGLAGMYSDGVSVRLNEYMEKYMPNFSRIVEENPLIARDLKLNDGSYTFVSTLYDINKEEDRAASSLYGLAIRKDWLDAVGKEVPTNMAEWYDVLCAFKQQDPNGNGQQDEEPVCMASSGWKYFLTAYGIDDDPIVQTDENGNETVIYGFMTDAYKQYLAEMNRWNTDGLIYNMFEGTSLEKRQERVTGNFAGAWKADADHFDYERNGSYLSILREKAPAAEFAAVEWPRTADGKQWCYSDINTFHRDTTVVTNKAVEDGHAEAACYIIDYMLSPRGSDYLTWGIEGESYEVVNGEKQLKDGMDEKVRFVDTEIKAFNQYADPVTIAFPTFGTVSEFVLSQQPDTYIEAVKTWSRGDTSYKMPPACQLSAEQEKQSNEAVDNMKNYVTKMRQRFIQGTEPMTNFDTYVSNVKRLGGEEYSQIWQEAYTAWKNR